MSRFYPSHPLVGVGIVIWKENQFCLPGGAQELGETYFETAKRETFEETNMVVEVLGLVDVVDSITHDDEGKVKQHYTLVDVYAKWVSGEPQGGSDAMEAAWYPFETLESLKLWSETERIIQKSHALLHD